MFCFHVSCMKLNRSTSPCSVQGCVILPWLIHAGVLQAALSQELKSKGPGSNIPWRLLWQASGSHLIHVLWKQFHNVSVGLLTLFSYLDEIWKLSYFSSSPPPHAYNPMNFLQIVAKLILMEATYSSVYRPALWCIWWRWNAEAWPKSQWDFPFGIQSICCLISLLP